MSFAPLLNAAPAIPVHAFAAMAAFVLGVVQLAAPKGTLPHRTLGWIWVGPMLSVAVSSFWIHKIRLIGPWSPIHLLSIFTLAMVPLGVWKAHRHEVTDHRRILVFSGDRRAVHVAAGADHARRRVRPLAIVASLHPKGHSGAGNRACRAGSNGRFCGCGDGACVPRKSLEKRREKPVAARS
jgi:uncharacterized membrane protein